MACGLVDLEETRGWFSSATGRWNWGRCRQQTDRSSWAFCKLDGWVVKLDSYFLVMAFSPSHVLPDYSCSIIVAQCTPC